MNIKDFHNLCLEKTCRDQYILEVRVMDELDVEIFNLSESSFLISTFHQCMILGFV